MANWEGRTEETGAMGPGSPPHQYNPTYQNGSRFPVAVPNSPKSNLAGPERHPALGIGTGYSMANEIYGDGSDDFSSCNPKFRMLYESFEMFDTKTDQDHNFQLELKDRLETLRSEDRKMTQQLHEFKALVPHLRDVCRIRKQKCACFSVRARKDR